MHIRHEPLLTWLRDTVPGSKLYGPYSHGDRHYFQWTIRGKALATQLIPYLDSCDALQVDSYTAERYETMKATYQAFIRRQQKAMKIPTAEMP